MGGAQSRRIVESYGRGTMGLTVSGLFLFFTVSAAAFGGPPGKSAYDPIPARSISPLRLLFFQFTPEGAETLGKGRSIASWDLSESNVINIPNDVQGLETEFDAVLNFEISRLLLRLRYGASESWDLGLEIPMYRFHPGFLDAAIVNVEDALGDLKPSRVFERSTPDGDAFRYLLKHDQASFFELSGPTSGLGDVAITAKKKLLSQGSGRPAVSLRLAFELPTGDEERALGSGDLDAAAGLSIAYLEKRWGLYGNANVTVPFGDPFREAGLETRVSFTGQVGGAFRLGPVWVIHGQLAFTSGPFDLDPGRDPSALPRGNLKEFGGPLVDATVGVSREIDERIRMHLAISEDIFNTASAAADVSLLASFSIHSR